MSRHALHPPFISAYMNQTSLLYASSVSTRFYSS